MLKMLKQSIFSAKFMFGYNGLNLFDQKFSLCNYLCWKLRETITMCELLVTSESPVNASNPLSMGTAGRASGVPRRSYK